VFKANKTFKSLSDQILKFNLSVQGKSQKLGYKWSFGVMATDKKLKFKHLKAKNEDILSFQ